MLCKAPFWVAVDVNLCGGGGSGANLLCFYMWIGWPLLATLLGSDVPALSWFIKSVLGLPLSSPWCLLLFMPPRAFCASKNCWFTLYELMPCSFSAVLCQRMASITYLLLLICISVVPAFSYASVLMSSLM